MASAPKVFVVGFQKTGTTSLMRALQILDIHITNVIRSTNQALRQEPSDPDATILDIAEKAAEDSDGLQDSPCAFVFEHLDKTFPGSKFILTYRDPEGWLESYRNYFPDENSPLRRWMYGVDKLSGNEAHYLDVFRDQNDKIREHFRDRPDDFLEMNLRQGDGWYELVNFLGKERVGGFPREKAREKKKTRIFGVF